MKRILFLMLCIVSLAQAQQTAPWTKDKLTDTLRVAGKTWGIRTGFVTFPDGTKMSTVPSGLTGITVQVQDSLDVKLNRSEAAGLLSVAAVTKSSIIDSLNATSPNVATLTRPFRFTSTSNYLAFDTASGTLGFFSGGLNVGTTGSSLALVSLSQASGADNAMTLDISHTGTSSGTSIGLNLTNSGASTINKALNVGSLNGTTDYAIYSWLGLNYFNGYAGFGVQSPTVPIQVQSNGEALRLQYNSSVYSGFAVNSSGSLVLSPTGGYVIVGSDTLGSLQDIRDFVASGGLAIGTAAYWDSTEIAARIDGKQAAGTYLVPSDTVALRDGLDGKQASGTYLVPADSTLLHNAIAGKLSPADTSVLLYSRTRTNELLALKQAAGTYIIPSDTTLLHNQIAGKLRPADVGNGAYFDTTKYHGSLSINQLGTTVKLGANDTVPSMAWVRTQVGTGGGSGEINTASNLGGGVANYSTKVGADLRFNSFAPYYHTLASNLIYPDTATALATRSWASGMARDTNVAHGVAIETQVGHIPYLRTADTLGNGPIVRGTSADSVALVTDLASKLDTSDAFVFHMSSPLTVGEPLVMITADSIAAVPNIDSLAVRVQTMTGDFRSYINSSLAYFNVLSGGVTIGNDTTTAHLYLNSGYGTIYRYQQIQFLNAGLGKWTIATGGVENMYTLSNAKTGDRVFCADTNSNIGINTIPVATDRFKILGDNTALNLQTWYRSASGTAVASIDSTGKLTASNIGTGAARDSSYEVAQAALKKTISSFTSDTTVSTGKIITREAVRTEARLLSIPVDSSYINTTDTLKVWIPVPSAITVDSIIAVSSNGVACDVDMKIIHGVNSATGWTLIDNTAFTVTSYTTPQSWTTGFEGPSILARSMIGILFSETTTKPKEVMVGIYYHLTSF